MGLLVLHPRNTADGPKQSTDGVPGRAEGKYRCPSRRPPARERALAAFPATMAVRPATIMYKQPAPWHSEVGVDQPADASTRHGVRTPCPPWPTRNPSTALAASASTRCWRPKAGRSSPLTTAAP